MYRMDKTAFRIQSFKEAADNRTYWLSKTLAERLAAAAYLNSVAYNYPLNDPPRLDKSFFKMGRQSDR